MPLYKVELRAIDTDKHEIVYATSVERLVKQLQATQQLVLQVEPYQPNKLTLWFERRSIEQAWSFLLELLKNGVPLTRALELVSLQMHGLTAKLFATVHQAISHGVPFWRIVQETALLNDMEIGMLKAAESHGALVQALEQIVSMRGDLARLSTTFLRLLAWPVIGIVGIAVLFLSFLLLIVPMLESAAHSSGMLLNDQQKAIIKASLWLQQNGYLLAIITPIIIASFVCVIRMLGKKTWLYSWLFKLPGIGRFIMVNHYMRALKTTRASLLTGIDLLQSLDYAHYVVSNAFLKQEIQQIHVQVAAGIPFDQAIRDSLFGQMMPESETFIAMGLASGNLAESIGRLDAMLAERFNRSVERIILLMQPIMLIVMGLFVAWLLASFYMPLIQMPLLAQENIVI